jgi:hypothetical protein
MPVGAPELAVAALVLLAPLALYALVRAEGRDRESMNREDAERAARRDTREDER